MMTLAGSSGLMTAGPNVVRGTGFTSGDPPPVISQDASHMERGATAGVYEGNPQHVASGAVANRPNHEVPTATGRRRRPLLPVDAEDDLTRLKARLVKGGATVEAAELCDDVFKDGISRGELERRLTHSQCEHLGLRDGKAFQVFLERVEVMGGVTNRCRLCPMDDAMTFKHHRSGLRHLLKDHFGLSFECTHW